MADASNLKVAVERAIHDALATAIQAISDQHQLQVTMVEVAWMDLTDNDTVFKIMRLQTTQFSKPRR